MESKAFEAVVCEAKEAIALAKRGALIMVRTAATARLKAIALGVTAETRDGAWYELKYIKGEMYGHTPENFVYVGSRSENDYEAALELAFRAILAAYGGILADVEPLMCFNLANTFFDDTIYTACYACGKGNSDMQDEIKAFVKNLPKHRDVATLADPAVVSIVNRACRGITGTHVRGNEWMKRVSDLYKDQTRYSKRSRAEE